MIPVDHHIACSQAAAHHCLERQRACWESGSTRCGWLTPLCCQSARLPIHAFSHWQTLLRFPGPARTRMWLSRHAARLSACLTTALPSDCCFRQQTNGRLKVLALSLAALVLVIDKFVQAIPCAFAYLRLIVQTFCSRRQMQCSHGALPHRARLPNANPSGESFSRIASTEVHCVALLCGNHQGEANRPPSAQPGKYR